MPEPLFASPVTKTYPTSPDATLVLSDESHLSKLVIRAAVGTDAKAHLAVPFGQSRQIDGLLIAGTRPDEFMLLGSADAVASRVAGLPTDGHVSLVDWTHGRAAFRLSGSNSAKVLEKICNVDWSDNMTPDGAVFSASIAGTTCDVVRADDHARSYLLLCDRSFAQYLFDTILDSGDEFGIAVS